jgi:hypothetical protein
MHRQIQELLAFQADAVRDPRGWTQTVKMTATRRDSVKILHQLRPTVPLEFLFCDGTQHLFIAKVGGTHILLDGETDGLHSMHTDYGKFTAEPHKRRIILEALDGSRWQWDSKGWKVLKRAQVALDGSDTVLVVDSPLLLQICEGLANQGFQAVLEGSQLVITKDEECFVLEVHSSTLTLPIGVEDEELEEIDA